MELAVLPRREAVAADLRAQPHTFHVSFEEISITIAAQAAFVLTLYLGWRLLRELDLPAGPAVLFLTTFGSPLFYYVVFEPAMKHAVDTLWITAAVYVLLRIYDEGTDRQAVLLGLLVAVALNTRYVNSRSSSLPRAVCLHSSVIDRWPSPARRR